MNQLAKVDRNLEMTLVEQAKQGNQQSFGELVRKYQMQLYSVALRMLRNDADAQDVVQETFFRAFRALSKFRGESSFGTWLTRITVNLSSRMLRSKPFEVPLENSLAGPSLVREIEKRDLASRVREAVNRLPELYRTVIILHHMEGYSYQEVSDILKCPLGTVMSRLHVAKKLLKNELPQEEISR